MKKLLTLLMAVLMVMSLAACSKKEEEVTPEPEAPETEVFDPLFKDEGVMTYQEYAAAAIGDPVVIEAFVQGAQSYYNGAKLYLSDPDGAYFVYCDGKGEDINLSMDDYAKLVPNTDFSEGWMGKGTGVKVMVTGIKSEWSGEVEITESTVVILDSETWNAEPIDVTKYLGTPDLEKYMNCYVLFTGLTLEPSLDAEGNEVAYLYNWDGSGERGSDLYFNVSYEGNTYTFTVESYLCYPDSEPYDALENLVAIGDTVEVAGFLYWYNGANPHVMEISVQ